MRPIQTLLEGLMAKRKILIIGGGAREHALAWALNDSLNVRLSVSPGNGGTAGIAHNLGVSANDISALTTMAKELGADLTVVGGEEPLAHGIVNAFETQGLRIFGPTREAARLESSKAFAKRLMTEVGIPTAPYRIFDDYRAACNYLYFFQGGTPVVIKASGLAQGKGVRVCRSYKEAVQELAVLMEERIYGAAGDEVVIEDYVPGREVSLQVLVDGEHYVVLKPVEDYKQLLAGDRGPMTGGVGAITPVPWVTPSLMRKIEKGVLQPLLRKLNGAFKGVLYLGLMVRGEGFHVLEFNVRFGDPETQALLLLLKTDLYDILDACVEGRLKDVPIEWYRGTAATIVATSRGYPERSETGAVISGLEEAAKFSNTHVFHAGTGLKEGKLVATGGRVLAVSAWGPTRNAALSWGYAAMEGILFEGKYCRPDIGQRGA